MSEHQMTREIIKDLASVANRSCASFANFRITWPSTSKNTGY